MKLAGALVVVTGGASGLGLAIAEALLQAGATPIILDRDREALDKVAARLGCPGYAVELTDPAAIDGVVERLCAEHGTPQGLINNAGILRSAPLLSLGNPRDPRHSVDLWNEVLAINLTAVFLVTRAVADRMVRQRVRGAVVSMSSISARGNAGQTAYSAAKAGVEAMTRVWAKELGPLGLRFIAVAPGYVDTPSTRTAVPEDILENLRRETPLRRLGKPEQIAETVLFALRNDMLTGTTLAVDGGLAM
ncbi:MAG: SDR family NAD(P)-dependent oxidoreductase [Sulfuritalea sp.]|nr:SDR family NAD(P)-dependent oxidoreductase [Sulfuritalea sp.]